MTEVVVYTKDGCHLCERVISALKTLASEQPFDMATMDITTSAELFERYQYVIPVVEIDGKVRLGGAALSNPITLEDVLRKALSV